MDGRDVEPDSWLHSDQPRLQELLRGAPFRAWSAGAELTATTGKPFAVMTPSGPRWKEPVELIESKLLEPLSWRKPKRVFVNSMSDLFHEDLPDEAIDRVFAVMALTPHITYQVLTKRPERMLKWANDDYCRDKIAMTLGYPEFQKYAPRPLQGQGPLPNVWLGVSVEDQTTADARIPLLLQTPAAKRFVSYEPALGPVDFTSIEWPNKQGHRVDVLRRGYWNEYGVIAFGRFAELGAKRGGFTNHSDMSGLDQIIVGGESGPAARFFNVAWARKTVEQCREAGVACFVKQMGSQPYLAAEETILSWPVGVGISAHAGEAYLRLKDRSGADPSEWPEELRVREFPA